MAFLIQFFVISSAILAVFGAGTTFTVTTSAQDYLKIVQAEMLFSVRIAELENDAFTARFDDRFLDIKLHQLQSLNLTQQVNLTLLPQQVLSIARKYCIQKYAPQLITYDDAKLQFDKCNRAGQIQRDNLYAFSPLATSSVAAAKKYAQVDLPNSCRGCNSYTNQTLLQDCYIETVELGTKTFNSHLNAAKQNLETAYSGMNEIIQQGVTCSFKTTKELLFNIKLTTSQISGCVEVESKKKSPYSTYEAKTVKNLIMGASN